MVQSVNYFLNLSDLKLDDYDDKVVEVGQDESNNAITQTKDYEEKSTSSKEFIKK
jgi:hypothetical protein